MASVITLRYPGTVVDDRDIDLMMSSIERELMQAAVCLRGFLWLTASRSSSLERRKPRPRYPETGNLYQLLEVDWRIRRERQRRDRDDAKRALDRFASGRIPRRYRGTLILVYARGFVESLNLVRAGLEALPRSRPLKAILKPLKRAQPHLTGIRDSSAHRDERRLGRAEGKKIPARLIMTEILFGDRLTSTLKDGSTGEVEVSPTTLRVFVSAVQKTIDQLPWTGIPRQVHL